MTLNEEISSHFYSWGLQRTVVKKVCSIAFFLAFSFFGCYQMSPFPLRTSASVRRKGSPSSSWRWWQRCYHWPVNTFISVELLTGWVWQVGASWTSVEPVWKPVLNYQNLATWFPYIAIWWINSKVPEGLMITSENSSAARESSRVIILKSRLNSTGHSASTSKVCDIFDRQTHVPNDWWQLMCSNVLQPWAHLNSMMVPVCNITLRPHLKGNKNLVYFSATKVPLKENANRTRAIFGTSFKIFGKFLDIL